MEITVPLLLLAAAADVCAVATFGRPAVVRPEIAAQARCAAHPQLVIAITAFTPPERGHASLTVTLRGDGVRKRLGEVAIYPEQAFTSPPAQAQTFGFPLPGRAIPRHPQVIVEMTSPDRSAAGGRARVGSARIGPAPQERC